LHRFTAVRTCGAWVVVWGDARAPAPVSVLVTTLRGLKNMCQAIVNAMC
jgi:hypothetical protein